MKIPGFVGPAYTLDSVNVDNQRCVNLYPEVIESGTGKEGSTLYYRATPGLEEIAEVGDGPIRCIHVDPVNRVFVVSGNELYQLTHKDDWKIHISYRPHFVNFDSTGSDINYTTNRITPTFTLSVAPTEPVLVKLTKDSGKNLPTGLTERAEGYWLFEVSTGVYAFADTLALAIAGTAIDISDPTNVGFNARTLSTSDVGGDGREPVYSIESVELATLTDINYATGQLGADSAFSSFQTGMRVRVYYEGKLPEEIDPDVEKYFYLYISSNKAYLAESISDANSGTVFSMTEPEGDWAASPYGPVALGTSPDTLDTSSGPVFARSGIAGDGEEYSTVFVDGLKIYAANREEHSSVPGAYSFILRKIASPPGPTHVSWVDGSFVVNTEDSRKIYFSELLDTTFSELDFSSAEGTPGTVQALIENHREIFVFTEKSCEVFAFSGNPDLPLERIPGGFLEIGILAPASLAKIAGHIFWLGRSNEGRGTVYMAAGMSPQRISTHAIEQAINSYDDISSATAWAYEYGGHFFYVLNFDEATWVYDLTTKLWHERAYLNSGDLERHRVGTHYYHPGADVHIGGDYESNKIYVISESIYDDNGDPIQRLRSSPHISSDLKRVRCLNFQLDMEVGIGLVSGQGSDPQVMLQWSNDGGHTWSDESWTSAGGQVGGIGEYNTRVKWDRLGIFRDRIWRIKMTDPVKWRITGAHMDVVPLGS